MATSNMTSPYFDIDERYHIIGGFLCFCVNIFTLANWRNLRYNPVFPVLLSLCVANALKSSGYYVTGLKTLFLHYYHDTSYETNRGTFGDWSWIWLFVGNQAVSWTSLGLAFDRFVCAAYPDQYRNTKGLYRLSVVCSCWVMTSLTSLAAFMYSSRTGVNFWFEITIVRNGAPSLVAFFRCLDTACAISCFVFLMSTVVVYGKSVNERKKNKSKWRKKMRVGPQRKNGIVGPSSRQLIYVNEIQRVGSPLMLLVPGLVSLYFNGTMWLLPAVVWFARTASADALKFHSTTLFLLTLFRSWHGSVDVLVHTLNATGLGRKLLCCCRGSNSSVSLASRTGNSNISVATYQACSSTPVNTSCMYLEYTNIDEVSTYY